MAGSLIEMEIAPKMYPIVKLHPLVTKVMECKQQDAKRWSNININAKLLQTIHPGDWVDCLITQPPLREIKINRETIHPSKGKGITFRDILEAPIIISWGTSARYPVGKVPSIAYELQWEELVACRMIKRVGAGKWRDPTKIKTRWA